MILMKKYRQCLYFFLVFFFAYYYIIIIYIGRKCNNDYGNIIKEQQLNNLIKSPIEIIQEYYENEISLLNSTIEYQNSITKEGILTESDIEYLHEGFIGNIFEKIKEILRKFKEWLSNIFKSIKNIFSRDKKTDSQKAEEVKKDIEKIDKDTTKTDEQKIQEKIKVVSKTKKVEKSEESKNSDFGSIGEKIYDIKLVEAGYQKIFKTTEYMLSTFETMKFSSITDEKANSFIQEIKEFKIEEKAKESINTVDNTTKIIKFDSDDFNKFMTDNEFTNGLNKLKDDLSIKIKTYEKRIDRLSRQLEEDKKIAEEYGTKQSQAYASMINCMISELRLSISCATKYLQHFSDKKYNGTLIF